MNYFDSSALVKYFSAEAGSERVRRLCQQGRIATATVAFAEVHAALARKRREHQIEQNGYDRISSDFDRDWTAYTKVQLLPDVLGLVRDLVQRQPLRSFDAIHLASALALKAETGLDLGFVAGDRALLQAARAEGLTPIDVS